MARNVTDGKHARICEFCRNTFKTNWAGAKTCSNRCRVALHRERKRGNGRSWSDVQSEFIVAAQNIRHLSPSAYAALEKILSIWGAHATEEAIVAVTDMTWAMLEVIERDQKAS